MRKCKSLLPIVLICIFIAWQAEAKKSTVPSKEAPVKIEKDWELLGSASEEYATPLGKVYKFSKFYPFEELFPGHYRCQKENCNICKERELHKNDMAGLQVKLFRNQREAKEKSRRFVVIDFKMRVFPAFMKPKHNDLNVMFTTAYSDKTDGIKDYTNVHTHMTAKGIYGGFSFLSLYTGFSVLRPPVLTCHQHPEWEVGAEHNKIYIANYNPSYIRLILDTRTGSQRLYGHNFDGLNFTFHTEKTKEMPDESIQTIAFFPAWKDSWFELSNPTVFLLDYEDDFEKLPEIKPFNYPYGAYPVLSQEKKDRNDRKNSKNPDFIYANALRYLEGKDVECDMTRGIELLQDAVKDDHLFAMYQLGLCHYRGMGVEQSDKIARKYFNMAEKIGHIPSETMLDLMDYLVRYKTHYDYVEPLPGDMTARKISNTPTEDLFKDKYKAGPLPGMIFSCLPFPWSAYGDYVVNPKTAFYAASTVYAVRRENQLSAADKARMINMNSEVEALMKKYGFFIYYPMESKNAVLFYRSKCLDYSVESGFTPAMLYKGYIFSCDFFKWPWKSADFDADALALFERGAGLGNIDCYAHVLRMKLKKNQDVSAEFKKNPFKLDVLDNPLYLLMKYCAENKDFPGRKLLIDYDLPEAENFFKAKNDPASKYLYALINLEMCFGVGRQLSDGMNLEYFKVGLKSLKESVAGGIDDGLYLLGKYELYGKLTDSTPNEGIKHLQAAVKNDHIGAMWLLTQKNWEKNKKYDETMKEIKPLLDIGIYPEVWAFAAEVAQRNTSGKTADVVALYEKAAELGHAQSCNTLALAYYNGKLGLKKDTKKASEYWKMFLKFDTAQRNQDPMDIYYGEDKLPKLMMDACGLPVNPARNINDIPKEKKYFDTFIVTGGDANPVRQQK